ncbi:MAG: GAF domain-containing protein [Anaerolineae bacterium]|nr:GAF domain-containing protein [Anaerolineae bacterium]
MTEAPEGQKRNLRDELLEMRKNLSYIEGIMREAARVGGVKLPPFTTQSMRQMQTQLSDIAHYVDDMQVQLVAYKDLARTSTLINSSLEIDEVLNEVMDTVIALTGAERGYLTLVQENTGELEFKTARNMDRTTLDEADFAVSRSIIHKVAQSGEPVVTTDASMDPRFSTQASVVNFNLRSILCVPLKLRDRVVGTVYADNKGMRGLFTDNDLKILTAFANQAAIAIGNAKQFGQVKADLEEAHRQVEELRIVIDEAKRKAQVESITESDFFQQLQREAEKRRRRRDQD